MKKIIMLLSALLLITSCSTTSKVYLPNKDGNLEQVAEIKQDSAGKVSYSIEEKPDGTRKITVEAQPSNAGNWITRHFLPTTSE